MPFRFRRSIRIAPDVRLGLGKRGVSASATLPGTGILLHADDASRWGRPQTDRSGSRTYAGLVPCHHSADRAGQMIKGA